MELNELSDEIRDSLNSAFSLYLLKFNKKTYTYQSDRLNLNLDYLKENLKTLMDFIIDKVNDYDGIIPYTEGMISKGYLSEIKLEDERIKDNYTRLHESVMNSGAEILNNYAGYIIYGKDAENKEIMIVTTSNPVVNLKGMMITPAGESFTEPMLIKFTKRIDVIIIDGHAYGEASKLEGLFGLESSTKALCESNRKLIMDEKIFADSATEMLMNPKIIRSYKNIDPENIKNLKEHTSDIDALHKNAEFEYLSDGKIHLVDTNACKLMLKYLCGRIVEKNGKLYEAGSLTPLPELNKE